MQSFIYVPQNACSPFIRHPLKVLWIIMCILAIIALHIFNYSYTKHTMSQIWSLAQRNRLYHLHLHVFTISVVYGSLANDHVLFQKKHACYIVIFLMVITKFYHLSFLNLFFVIIPIDYMVNIYKTFALCSRLLIQILIIAI